MSEPRAKRRHAPGDAYRAAPPAKRAAARRANAPALPPAEAEALARNHERIEERRITRRG